jgi:hypothetical protein
MAAQEHARQYIEQLMTVDELIGEFALQNEDQLR